MNYKVHQTRLVFLHRKFLRIQTSQNILFFSLPGKNFKSIDKVWFCKTWDLQYSLKMCFMETIWKKISLKVNHYGFYVIKYFNRKYFFFFKCQLIKFIYINTTFSLFCNLPVPIVVSKAIKGVQPHQNMTTCHRKPFNISDKIRLQLK